MGAGPTSQTIPAGPGVPEGGAPHALPPPLFERSDAAGLTRLAAHLALVAVTWTLLQAGLDTVLVVPAMIAHGVALTFLFCPLHECIHATAFRRRRLNDAVAFLCGLVLLLPREFFRDFHLTHHRHTQDPQRDPELAVRKPATMVDYLLHVSGLPYWRERIGAMLRHARGAVPEPFIPARRHALIVREARLHLCLYLLAAAASLLAGSAALLVYWIVPVLVGQPFLRAFLLAEHTGCPYVPDMFVNTRTTLTGAAVRFLTWNMPYHAEHHAWAAVPFHRLPEVHALVRRRIAHTAPGYIEVHRGLIRDLGKD